MSEQDPFGELVARLEAAKQQLEGVVTPEDAVVALEELQETTRQLSAEIDRRRRALTEDRGDGQLDLL